jgi:hypothetical protein
MCLRVSYKKKIWEKFFLASLKSLKKGVGSGVASGSISQRSGSGSALKMSRIPNTSVKYSHFREVKVC